MIFFSSKLFRISLSCRNLILESIKLGASVTVDSKAVSASSTRCTAIVEF